MNALECSYEKEVVAASRSHQWTDFLRRHTETCQTCKRAVELVSFLQSHSADTSTYVFPSYRLLWLRAQYAQKQEHLSALDLISLIGLWVVGTGGVVAFILWQLPQITVRLLGTVAKSMLDIKGVFSNGAPYAVAIGVFLLIWVLTRDSYSADR